MYYVKCPKKQCTEDYMGETGKHLIKRVKDHSGKDEKLHLFKHAIKTKYKKVSLDDFKIVEKGYKKSKLLGES